MIIIQMAGGLGNQMFQYALYKQLESMGKKVKMDDEEGFREDAQRTPALAAFGINYERASKEEIWKITDSSPRITAKVRRKLCGRHKKSYFEESKLFQPQIFEWDDIYLEGYWQSEQYFKDVAEQIRVAYSIENIRKQKENGYGMSECAEAYLKRIEQTPSVSIHIRRGDYLLPENQKLFGNICTELYYTKAIQEMLQKVPECVFYLFSNDMAWAKEWLPEIAKKADRNNRAENRIEGYRPFTERIVAVELPEGRDYEELLLMSRCKHNILANSSFSWWASYLNNNPDKTVLVPDKWLNGWDCRDIYRSDMRKISGEES
ncbi:MAG: alpha-1,2-fucosyltransferase [Lachnospiraceae bacterium]|nr:alpha-1,2-fucosyltransferase [Lachnospiraceae bacterium]